MSTHYDVLVCGAGPAGACAAYEAAAQGLRTLILEKRPLPRYKTCGGGVPLTIGSELPALAPEAFVEATVTHLRHTWNFRDPHLAAINPDPNEPAMSLWMVQRSVFDHALTQRAVRAGAALRDGLALRHLEPDGDHGVRVTTTDGDTLTAQAVIGADGANGMVARLAGLRPHRLLAIALEAEIPHRWGDGHETLRPEIAHLEYAVRQGYAWVFPKGDHLSVGAGMFGRRNADGRGDAKKEELARWVTGYLESLGVPRPADQIEFHGHPLPIWNGAEPLQAWNGRVLLAGDAAGMVNPLFGDGISYACLSGALAGQTVAEHAGPEWSERVRQRFAPSHDAALTLASYFYQFPAICYRLGVKHPRGTRIAARLISGDLGFDSVLDRVPWKRLMENAASPWLLRK